MPNKNYLNGIRKERKIVNDLKKEGWDIVQRSAGSRSPIDVWAINKDLKLIRLIQAKPDNFKGKDILELLTIYNWLNDNFKVEFKVEWYMI